MLRMALTFFPQICRWVAVEGGCLTSGLSQKPDLIAGALAKILIQPQQGEEELVPVSPVFLARTNLTKPAYKNSQRNVTLLHQESQGSGRRAIDTRKAME